MHGSELVLKYLRSPGCTYNSNQKPVRFKICNQLNWCAYITYTIIAVGWEYLKEDRNTCSCLEIELKREIAVGSKYVRL